MKIFLTHIDEEAGLAAVLKRWIEDTFPDKCEVFVSSDTDDIVLGDKWLNEVDQALNDAALFLVLCSPRSVRRPWVNFETGCGWIKRVPIIPICHSDQAKGQLPSPLSAFQGIETSQSDFAKELLTAIAKRCSNGKVPPIDYGRMMKEVRDAEQADVAASDTPEPSATGSAASDVTSLELKLLESLIGHDDTLDGVAGRVGRTATFVEFHLYELVEKHMVDVARNMNPDVPTIYSLGHEGSRVLIEAGLLE